MELPFALGERVVMFTADDEGNTAAEYGVVEMISEDPGTVYVRSVGQRAVLRRFMYSAPDDMWLRVVAEGESVECTRLAKPEYDDVLVESGAVNAKVFWESILDQMRGELKRKGVINERLIL